MIYFQNFFCHQLNSHYDCSCSHLCQVQKSKTTPGSGIATIYQPWQKCPISILQNVGPRQQAWVSWSAGALLIVILRMLAALFSGTWMMILATTTIKDQNAKHGQGKTIILHYTAILGATHHTEGIGKE